VKAGAYRTSLGETRAPHIHFPVTDGARRLVTQMFFPGEALNVQDRCLQSCRHPARLIARAIKPANALAQFSWRIVLPRRTPVPLSTHTLNEGRK
jgi:protocatechuate 3,4-dioxygenase beta subunit